MRKVLLVVVAAVVMAAASAVTGGGSSEASAWLVAPAACSLNTNISDEDNVSLNLGRGVNLSTTSNATFQCALMGGDTGTGPFPDTDNISWVTFTYYDGSPGASVYMNVGSYEQEDYSVYSVCGTLASGSGTGYGYTGWNNAGGLACMLAGRVPAGYMILPPHTGTTASKFLSMRVGGL